MAPRLRPDKCPHSSKIGGSSILRGQLIWQCVVDQISLEDLAWLEALVQVDQSAHNPETATLTSRLVEAGLAEFMHGSLVLTHAGVERCKSLHHRVRADKEAATVLKEREAGCGRS